MSIRNIALKTASGLLAAAFTVTVLAGAAPAGATPAGASTLEAHCMVRPICGPFDANPADPDANPADPDVIAAGAGFDGWYVPF